MFLVIVYLGLYVLFSIPSFQEKVKKIVCEETSLLLGGQVGVGELTIRPFSEVILNDISLTSPKGEECIDISKVAAGIDLWTLLSTRRIVINYAEIIGLKVEVEQSEKEGPLNIQFLIDALSPKDKNKPTKSFDLKIRNIVVRDSKARILRSWMRNDEGKLLPYADINLERLRIDLSIPELNNYLYRFDIRNVQFEVDPGVRVRSLSAEVAYSKGKTENEPDQVSIKDFKISFPNTTLAIGDLELTTDSPDNIHALVSGNVTPSDFAQILPVLKNYETPWDIDIDAEIKDKGIEFANMELVNHDLSSFLKFDGRIQDFSKKDSLNVYVNDLKANLTGKFLSDLAASLPGLSKEVRRIIDTTREIRLDLEGGIKDGNELEAKGDIWIDNGSIDFEGGVRAIKSRRPIINLDAEVENLKLGKLLGTDKIGEVSFTLAADVAGLDKNADGKIIMTSDAFEVMGQRLTELELEIEKSEEDLDVQLMTSAGDMNLDMAAFCRLAGKDSEVDADLAITNFDFSEFGIKGKLADSKMSTRLRAHTIGNSADNVTGRLRLADFTLIKPESQKLYLSDLTVNIDSIEKQEPDGKYGMPRKLTIKSDWIDGRIEGDFYPSKIAKEIKHMISNVFPNLMPSESLIVQTEDPLNDFEFDFSIKGASAPYNYFNTPVRPLANIPVSGRIDSRSGRIDLKFNTPHLQQGKNKLISKVGFSLSLDSFLRMAKMNACAIVPTKKGDVELAADVYAVNDKIRLDLGLNPTMESAVKGGVALEASFTKLLDPLNTGNGYAAHLEIMPSTISINDKGWSIGNGFIDYSGKKISVKNFVINHDTQFIKIEGVASESPKDKVKVNLNEIDLEYIFNILNINYVSFGGMATGEVEGSMLLTKKPEARTDYFHVKGLSYNGAELGDGDLASDYDSDSQKVGIYAVIRDPLTKQRKASVDGGIWVTRDSLSFNMDADKLNVGLMKPFVSAFCSDLNGEASGKCKLYGTFQDIDLTGALYADTLSMKLDFTNTWYHAGNDSVYLHKGVIDIPPLTLYDDEGHTAEFSGWLRHRYFHEPVFNFRLRDAKSLLCYDTNEKINPLWYGTIYGSGHAQINGYPGLIEIDMNMATEDNSKFYYVISDSEEVGEYSFLSFTDRRKEALEKVNRDTIPSYLTKFVKNKMEDESLSSNVILSLKGTVTNDALVTLVMDPKAGDNITARGQGALQMDYNLASNDLRMIGTYTLDEGNYNFTLQDIIIKNFNIKPGSQITFDGDPMNANLDIAATYRVNTNLTDLDKSFSTDKELNRTNVPVDALLIVKGQMTHPDITFDIELPSLTSDVERKVKSIVSTNDMMNKQIIYLLALNRFYTPEYTDSGNTNSGSEWSSMASSTISSQLSNILSQMTDKLDMAPSFRSDKGDFTDLEFDLALSSRLLNNRLLINGNFGYRDRSTSNTQFVGDFDIEYLLSKNGNLRLKAYNHFNDQNYYLRSALTTQGVGVVFRKDFERLFRSKKKEDESNDGILEGDSISAKDKIGKKEKEN